MKALSRHITIVVMMAVIAMAAKANIYHNETHKCTHFDYSNYTYTYIENGVEDDTQGEERTVLLTEPATTTDQMCALIRKVFTDKTIPGIHYAYDYNGTQYRKIIYNFIGHLLISQSEGHPWQRESAGLTFEDPEQDGMTMMLVELKQSWNRSASTSSGWDAINKGFASMKLVPNFTRVNDPVNPGYIFCVDGAGSRFYFVSKGKPRNNYTRPLYRLFEQISPVNSYTNPNGELIDSLRAGRPFYCHHDCTNVPTMSTSGVPHWFQISNQGEAYGLRNLAIFMPDRRFEHQLHNDGDENRSVSSSYFNDYGNSQLDADERDYPLMPKVLLYTASLTATATPEPVGSEHEGYFRVDLNWSTSFNKDNIGVDVPQHFYVYIVDGNNRYQLVSVVDQPTEEYSHSYYVEQTVDEQTISYVITAHPINFDNDGNKLYNTDGTPYITMTAESPVRTVHIPGHTPFFTQISEFRSRYEIGDQVNVYKNKLSIRPVQEHDYLSIKNDVLPYDITRTDADGNKEVIATLKFTQSGSTGYDYTVNYVANTQNTDLLFDDEQPVTSGSCTSYADADIIIIDRFTASTENNEQSASYTYNLEKHDTYYSNTINVPVYKTDFQVDGVGYTLDEVNGDDDHGLKATPNNQVTFQAFYEPAANLVEYDVMRFENNATSNAKKICKAENFNNSGEYLLYGLSSDGRLTDRIGSVTINSEGGSITLPDVNASLNRQISTYVPVIATFFHGETDKPNTYGADFKKVEYPEVTVRAYGALKSAPYAGATGPVMSYSVNLDITPQVTDNIDMVYYYRVWRVMDNNSTLDPEILLNREENQSGEKTVDGVTGTWYSDYDALKEIYPGEQKQTIADHFQDNVYDGEKRISYIVRLYATPVPGSNSTAPDANMAPRRITSDGHDYFVAEKTVTVRFNNSTPTGVDGVLSECNVASVTYYNTMGVASDKPFTGVNIVVTTYENGISTTKKVIM